eukprot:TRINITY_DN7389_c0_g1_i1.p1 TRINITY_DN7389_c0_g1~~TRINITY_DN7389_c0_g1_i1.p1  ORF type:complete len:208 (+),score=26.58 TRINITY_DN7389_c0_g1_i1:100-723(+)
MDSESHNEPTNNVTILQEFDRIACKDALDTFPQNYETYVRYTSWFSRWCCRNAVQQCEVILKTYETASVDQHRADVEELLRRIDGIKRPKSLLWKLMSAYYARVVKRSFVIDTQNEFQRVEEESKRIAQENATLKQEMAATESAPDSKYNVLQTKYDKLEELCGHLKSQNDELDRQFADMKTHMTDLTAKLQSRHESSAEQLTAGPP